MKTVSLLLLLQIITAQAFAQDRKENRDKGQGRTEYFRNFPEKQEVNSSILQRIFQYKAGDKVNLTLSDSLTLRGVVLENVTHSSGVISVNIQSPEYPGLLFNFSKPSGNSTQPIRARIVGRNVTDALLLVQENNRYYLRQTPKDKLIVE